MLQLSFPRGSAVLMATTTTWPRMLSVHAGGLYVQVAGGPPTCRTGGQDAGQPNAEIYLTEESELRNL